MRLLPLFFLMALSTVHAAGNPAPLNGIWALTGASGAADPAATLVIVNGRLTGTYGCARFQGTLEAARNEAAAQVTMLPPRAGERCLFVLRHALLDDLNAAQQYTVSRRHLVLFSKTARLTFERIGYVTPAPK